MKLVSIDSVIWKEGKHYVAQCLNLDISSFGDTKEEALANLKEAVELYCEDESSAEFTTIENPEIIHAEITYA
ncbi:MAG: hypothetical protein LC122_06615 [Chitinophagales bacterium]|nr:hypothetical protein [Chitinophagales bacterium]